jgi:hypothetical protein
MKPRWFRYADNLTYLSSSVSEGEQTLIKVAQLLAPYGLTLKGKDGVVDLSQGEEAHLLGFTLSKKGNHLTYGINQEAWNSLALSLLDAHREANPTRAAQEAMLGWVDSLGPAFENGDADEVLSFVSHHGFREISLTMIKKRWKESWKRWKECHA